MKRWEGRENWAMRNFITCTCCNDPVMQYEMGRACSRDWEIAKAYGQLVGSPEGRRSLGRKDIRGLKTLR
jgi:hypothetical protein